jgi:hypothetical protein
LFVAATLKRDVVDDAVDGADDSTMLIARREAKRWY